MGPEDDGEFSVLSGKAPVSAMQNYAAELSAYTRGFGKLEIAEAGYYPCHNSDEIVFETGYDPEADLRDPAGSVFCEHGAGLYVNWDEVEDYMHLPLFTAQKKIKKNEDYETAVGVMPLEEQAGSLPENFDYMGHGYENDRELDRIFRASLSRNKKEEDPGRTTARRYDSVRPSGKVSYDNEGHLILP